TNVAPDAVRSFRTPAATLVGTIGILGCLYLFVSLPSKTQAYFAAWNVLGLLIYFAYARPRAHAE
ncbi:MAG: amino acid permease, partial [Sphingomonas sp.]